MRMQQPTAKHTTEKNPANKGSAHCSSYADARSLKQAVLDPVQVSYLQADFLKSPTSVQSHRTLRVCVFWYLPK